MSAAVIVLSAPSASPARCGPRSSSRSPPSCCSRSWPASCWCTPCWPRQSALPDADYLLAVGDEVRALRPEVAVYFSGSASSVYQLNMWLPVLEQLDRRPGDRSCGSGPTCTGSDETTLPVVCLPGAINLMDFRMPTVRVAFYVANVGKNLHFLREPRIKHVFHRPRRERQGRQRQPLHQGLRRDLGGGPDLPPALGRCRRRRPGRDGRRGGPPPAGGGPAGRRALARPAADRALRPDLGGVDRQPLRQLARPPWGPRWCAGCSSGPRRRG